MKKIAFVLMTVVLLAGSIVAVDSSTSLAQDYEYPPPPADIYAQPWAGPGTPWVYYNGDWFLNGVLYYFFGSLYGWAPYYAYPPVYIVRPGAWYSQRWFTWYHGHPSYWHGFLRHHPYWRTHRVGERYNRTFYERYNRGQGAGWQKGYRGVPPGARHPRGVRPGSPGAAPPAGKPPGAERYRQPQQRYQQQMRPQQRPQQQMRQGRQPQPQRRQMQPQQRFQQQQRQMQRQQRPQQQMRPQQRYQHQMQHGQPHQQGQQQQRQRQHGR